MIDNLTELVDKARSGDAAAFATLVQNYTPYIYRTAFALLHDAPEAEDVVQETFLKVYRTLGQLNESRAFHAWLTRIVTNHCLDRLKKHPPIPLPELDLNLISTDVTTNWDQRLFIMEALKQLSHEYREVLVLREWQGYDYQEIAALLKIPLGTVKSRIHTARLLLRKLLLEDGYVKE